MAAAVNALVCEPIANSVFSSTGSDLPSVRVPQLESDVYGIAALDRIGASLFPV